MVSEDTVFKLCTAIFSAKTPTDIKNKRNKIWFVPHKFSKNQLYCSYCLYPTFKLFLKIYLFILCVWVHCHCLLTHTHMTHMAERQRLKQRHTDRDRERHTNTKTDKHMYPAHTHTRFCIFLWFSCSFPESGVMFMQLAMPPSSQLFSLSRHTLRIHLQFSNHNDSFKTHLIIWTSLAFSGMRWRHHSEGSSFPMLTYNTYPLCAPGWCLDLSCMLRKLLSFLNLAKHTFPSLLNFVCSSVSRPPLVIQCHVSY